MQDDLLIQRAQAGNETAFAELLDQHYELMYRFAWKWSGSVADAEDITQQACIKLARSLPQFRFEAAFSTWLYRLVINCAKDWLKAEIRHRSEEELNDIHLDAVHTDTNSTNTNETSRYLQQILAYINTMAADYKETALLVFAEGLSHREAAEILGEKEKTVSWRIHEIRKQLQGKLQREHAP